MFKKSTSQIFLLLSTLNHLECEKKNKIKKIDKCVTQKSINTLILLKSTEIRRSQNDNIKNITMNSNLRICK